MPSMGTSASGMSVRWRETHFAHLQLLIHVSRGYLSLLRKRVEAYGRVIAEAATLEVILPFYYI